ncbi:zinc-dependent alcohol dehydrogenase family protein [Spiractinospora alimapuensis]|uniref:zinc-dependent alcohol dehydrogenase family protein n=1 Tax=Spiractinospora alimapuensis TaxID=2820884 RepID=UPI001F1C3D7D|nr:zinc-dependent alcohol dehydrogenase family protein [Spiractinospora alimapuensis]QVQ51416.1 zinc-dependent alcohol dehydrogenase family protein [Spiractinospora alimapuensis]
MDAVAAIVRAFGVAADVVGLEAEPVPRPGAGEVVVRMGVSVVNPSDLITISGAYPSRTSLPFRPGFEGVGTVVAAGHGGGPVSVGDRVLPIGTSGTWATHKVLPARWCFPVSDRLDVEQAATSYVNPVTAWLMLHGDSPVAPGSSVVVDAAASGIGRMLLRMLNEMDIEPIAVVRRPASVAALDSRVRAVVATDEGDVSARLMAATDGRPVDVVLDAVGGEVAGRLAGFLRPGGRLVHYGLLSGVPLPVWLHQPDSGVRVEPFRLRDWVHSAPRAQVASVLATAQDLVATGVARSEVDSRFPLTEVTAALRRQESPERRGKVLLDLD